MKPNEIIDGIADCNVKYDEEFLRAEEVKNVLDDLYSHIEHELPKPDIIFTYVENAMKTLGF